MSNILKFIISGTPNGFECFPSNDLSGFLDFQYKDNFNQESRFEIRKIDNQTIYTAAQYGYNNSKRPDGFIAISFVVANNHYCDKPYTLSQFLKSALNSAAFLFNGKSFKVENFQIANVELQNLISKAEKNFQRHFKGTIKPLPNISKNNSGTSKVKSINIINGTTDEIVNSFFLEFGAINFTSKEVQVFEELDSKIILEYNKILFDHKTGLRKVIKDLRSDYNIINDKHEKIKLLKEAEKFYGNEVPPVLALISISDKTITKNLDDLRIFKNKLNSFKNIKPESLQPLLSELNHFESELNSEKNKLKSKQEIIELMQKIGNNIPATEPITTPLPEDNDNKSVFNFDFKNKKNQIYIITSVLFLCLIGFGLYHFYPREKERNTTEPGSTIVASPLNDYENLSDNIKNKLNNETDSLNEVNYKEINKNIKLYTDKSQTKKQRIFCIEKGVFRRIDSILSKIKKTKNIYPEYISKLNIEELKEIRKEAEGELKKLKEGAEKKGGKKIVPNNGYAEKAIDRRKKVNVKR